MLNKRKQNKNKKIRDAWIAYPQVLKWWDDTNTTWVHSVAEIKQDTTTVSTIWYGKCADAEWEKISETIHTKTI